MKKEGSSFSQGFLSYREVDPGFSVGANVVAEAGGQALGAQRAAMQEHWAWISENDAEGWLKPGTVVPQAQGRLTEGVWVLL